jgi:uncharacterized DUF497 family protein
MVFERDLWGSKGKANLRKHGVSFEEAATVFRIDNPQCGSTNATC